MKSAKPREAISIILICQNEARRLDECLDSVRWADEIVVVDGGSTDASMEIASRYTDRVLLNPWPGYAAQKQFALDHASHPWVFSIDADEAVSPELREALLQVLKDDGPRDGYYVPRRSSFLGKWIWYGGWYPGYQLRLFRREKARVSLSHVHEGFLVDGDVGRLKGDLLHYSHPDLVSSLDKMNRYSTLEARDRVNRKRVRWFDFFTHPASEFLKKFMVKRGFRDGVHGLLLALVSAMVKMALYMKLWEIQRIGPAKPKGNESRSSDE